MVKNIADITANRMLSQKVDSATRHARRIMCVNIQFVYNTEVIVLTLSSKELNCKHSSKNVKEYVLAVLKRYNIQLEQIYSCTQDNGSELICAAKMLEFDGYNDSATVEDVDELDDGDELDSEDESESENESADDFESDDEYETLSETDESVDENIFNFDEELRKVEVVRCAAHTLALGVTDTLKKPNIEIKMKKIVKLVKLLRRPTYTVKLKAKNLKRPKKNNKTRWNTNYDMLLSLLPLKTFCADEVKEMRLSELEWGFCENFLEIFKPVKIATKRLQAQQLTPGDFYKVWLQLTLDVKKLTTAAKNKSLAEELLKNLMKRESFIFKTNKCLVAALYLDPRFRNILIKLRPNEFNVKEPQEHLLALYKQIKKIEKVRARPTTTGNPPTSTSTMPSTSTSSSNLPSTSTSSLNLPTITPSTVQSSPTTDKDDTLKSFIDELFEDNSEESQQVGEDDIVVEDRKPLDTNVLEYWHNKRFSNPILHKLAVVVHGVPATQVSVE